MRFDAYLMADWSAAALPAPARPKPDAIWYCLLHNGRARVAYCRTRQQAEAEIAAHCRRIRGRILLAFDFSFAYPGWVARALGGLDWHDMWLYLEERIRDEPRHNNRFDIAAELNHTLSGGPFPFWGTPRPNALLPATRPAGYGPAHDEWREPEHWLKRHWRQRPHSSFKLYTTGAVGSQMLVGLPALARLRRAFMSELSVWPWQPPDGRIVLIEMYPSPLDLDAVLEAPWALRPRRLPIKDARQVAAFANLCRRAAELDLLAALFTIPPDARHVAGDGWVFGANHAFPELLKQLHWSQS